MNCIITNSTDVGTFTITNTRPYFTVVTLLTQENIKLLQQIDSGLKRTIEQISNKRFKICVYQGSDFYNISMNSWLHDNGIEIYSTHNEEKSVIASI